MNQYIDANFVNEIISLSLTMTISYSDRHWTEHIYTVILSKRSRDNGAKEDYRYVHRAKSTGFDIIQKFGYMILSKKIVGLLYCISNTTF